MILALAVVIFFSVMGFWRLNPLLFMLAAGSSLMLGLYWYDAFTDNLGLTIGLMLIVYSLVCAGFAFKCIFWRERPSEE